MKKPCVCECLGAGCEREQSEAGIEMKISHEQVLIPSGAVIGDCARMNVPAPPSLPQGLHPP